MKTNGFTKILLLTLVCIILALCALAGCNTTNNSNTEFIYGTGAPSVETGKNGDYYLNTDDDTVYQKKRRCVAGNY